MIYDLFALPIRLIDVELFYGHQHANLNLYNYQTVHYILLFTSIKRGHDIGIPVSRKNVAVNRDNNSRNSKVCSTVGRHVSQCTDMITCDAVCVLWCGRSTMDRKQTIIWKLYKQS